MMNLVNNTGKEQYGKKWTQIIQKDVINSFI
jgi:hypothetical protein